MTRPSSHTAASPRSDDELIARLRERTWDPGRRFDAADVPVAWITQHYGGEQLSDDRTDIVSYCSDGTVQLKADAEEVTAFYADAPRGPLFPPVTRAEIGNAELRIGHRMPDLLRRVYTEVADGGFGPDSGLASLTEGNRPPGGYLDWPCSTSTHERQRGEGIPPSWLHLASGGCSMQWYLSLTAIDNPVLLHDSDGWEPTGRHGSGPHDGLRHASPSLRHWLWTWADGGSVWDDVLNRLPV
ncbi:SMI1/KNR4 family protein [Streptomyces sp. NPDC001272]